MHIRKANYKDYIEIGYVHVDTWKSSYEKILGQEYLNGLSYEKSQNMWKEILKDNDQNTFVLENEDGKIVGYICFGKERAKGVYGEIYGLYIQEKYQKNGMGFNLFQTAKQTFRSKGFESIIVWVLKDNVSCKFYEKMGGIYYESKNIIIGTKTLNEIAYKFNIK